MAAVTMAMPSGGRGFEALLMRLVRIWRSRWGSPWRVTGMLCATVTVNVSPFCAPVPENG